MDYAGKYVDGYVLPLPKAKVEAFREFAARVGAIWREHGALAYVECVGEDVKPGTYTSFPQAVDLQADETVVFAWIVFPSRAERDRINAAVMADPRSAVISQDPMMFDGKRMFWGGFDVLVDV
ncbi:DUF1428 family protein [Rhodoplanes serenus]|uniref:DUF1428 family protein n=1 Tax=Rhodoplanes serenus TaxID=200615 RepID=A0A447CSJ1_9BRAD|nr:DUF1428 domain-containing protein [Rhodoplanes serenus]MBI5113567.1 DUF1428 domain-containing protein [Rhodovulum sp.]MTW19071.1 DUF1428 family protein [Rhodoplanes serenus]VCU08212.1 hypothetical protein RHODGE_RHODGE_02071 [Rhodoplanes serenus]